jgi:chromatin segregation and condensation protein Rec8/ScpA/Scc1 (kleisin family)
MARSWRKCRATFTFPPDALEIILDSFEGPLDLLLYLIRRANINVLDIPMAPLTAQYLSTSRRCARATWNWPPNTC